MPAVFLDRLPLPSLQAYTVVSVALLSCSIYYAVQITSSSEWKFNATHFEDGRTLEEVKEAANISLVVASVNTLILDFPLIVRTLEIFKFMIQEPLCIWTLINMAYCCLISIGKVIQKFVFGELRASEQQHIKDKFWNFVFYKFIFIFGVMNVQFMDDIVLWCSWFSILGFLHLLAQLSKDRFEYLSFSPTTPKWAHVRLLMLLGGIMLVSTSLFGICIVVGIKCGLNTFAFMSAECSLVTVRTLYVIARYAIHLWDTHHVGVWERRSTYIYYTELFFELVALATDFFHHLHMLVWGNIFLSMASLVICMQLRFLFYEIRRRVKKHKNYLRVIKHMEANYKMASVTDLENNRDDCAICWDHMDSARKLPCGHLFHNSCLCSWLEQDSSCPTCRMSLRQNAAEAAGGQTEEEREDQNQLLGRVGITGGGVGRGPTLLLAAFGPRTPNGGGQNGETNQRTNHFFHFDGSRYVSWFPSFSVEVTHTNLLGDRLVPIQTSQLDTMARQVHQLFPHMPMNVITDDLRATRSMEVTVENILEERLLPPLFHGSHSAANPEAVNVPTLNQPEENGLSTNDKIDNLLDFESQNNEELVAPLMNNLNDGSNSWHPSGVARTEPLSTSTALWDTRPDSSENDKAAESLIVPLSGCRFSKSPQEREVMLAERKEELLKIARRRYLTREDEN